MAFKLFDEDYGDYGRGRKVKTATDSQDSESWAIDMAQNLRRANTEVREMLLRDIRKERSRKDFKLLQSYLNELESTETFFERQRKKK